MTRGAGRTIAVASALYGLSMLVSRVLGVVRESVIGRTLGAGRQADVYFSAFVIPDYVGYLLASGALSLVFIPMFQRHLVAGREDEGWRAFSNIANFLVIAGVLATAAFWWAAPALADLVAPGFDEAERARWVYLTRVILPGQIFHLVGGLLTATLQARDKHALPALAPLVYTAGVIAGGLLLGRRLGAEGFAWGVLAGSALGPFLLPLAGCLRAGMRWHATLDLRHEDFRRYIKLSIPIMLGFSIVFMDETIVKRYASEVGEGVIAQLQYARTLMRVPMGMFGMAAGIAAFPTLSRLVAEGRHQEAYAMLVKATRTTLLLAFAAQAALTAAGAEVATVIWGRARFSAADLDAIGAYTGLLCVGLWAWSAQGLVARGFYARQNTWAPTVLGSVVVVLMLPLYAWGARAGGGTGLALASSAAISVYVVALTLLLRHGIARAPGPGLLDAVLKQGACAALGVGLGLALDRALPAWPALLRGGLTGGVALVATFAAARLLRVPEAVTLQAMALRRVSGRRRSN